LQIEPPTVERMLRVARSALRQQSRTRRRGSLTGSIRRRGSPDLIAVTADDDSGNDASASLPALIKASLVALVHRREFAIPDTLVDMSARLNNRLRNAGQRPVSGSIQQVSPTALPNATLAHRSRIGFRSMVRGAA
jgi:hypothetical protein